MNSILESAAYLEFSKQYFHNQPIPVSSRDFKAIEGSIKNFWALVQNPEYQKEVLGQSNSNFLSAPIMGYDFHIGSEGPKLIEVNSNAAGLLITGTNSRYWSNPKSLSEKVVEIFTREAGAGSTIAIVDQNPPAQFYHLEFDVLKQILSSSGFKVFVLDPQQLTINASGISSENQKIDFIYWRHTDFLLEGFPEIKKAYQSGLVKLSPTPEIFSLLSDKTNLIRWSRKIPDNLKELILICEPVTSENADYLWETRKNWVFKPAQRFGGKGVYVGKKVTLGKWEEIKNSGDYLAQEYLQPQEANVPEAIEKIKIDFRAYAWRDELLLLVARGYSGQVTNFRTAGGGFYPVKNI